MVNEKRYNTEDICRYVKCKKVSDVLPADAAQHPGESVTPGLALAVLPLPWVTFIGQITKNNYFSMTEKYI